MAKATRTRKSGRSARKAKAKGRKATRTERMRGGIPSTARTEPSAMRTWAVTRSPATDEQHAPAMPRPAPAPAPAPGSGGVNANASVRELREIARGLDIPGRSTMNKADLVRAIQQAKAQTQPQWKAPVAARG